MNAGWKIVLRSAAFVLALFALIFLPAGTLHYWQAWTLLGVYAVSGTALGTYMWKYERALFELRMKQGPQAEKSPAQRVIVMRENRFASGAIELNAGQYVISTGPYSIVRHPMYIGLLLVALGVPLAMGSYYSLLDEEQFLVKNLPGSKEYRTQTRWRLVPGVF